MKLPFKVHDGTTKRSSDLKDLTIMCELNLDFTVYSTEKYWFFFRREIHPDIVFIVYSAVRAINKRATLSPLMTTAVINSYQIHRIVCKDLHKWKDNSLLNMMIDKGFL